MNLFYKAFRCLRRNKALLGLLLLTTSAITGYSQAIKPCYTPVYGPNTVAAAVQSDALCLGCTYVPNPSNITDGDTSNFSEYNTSIGLATGSGVSVRDTVGTYPAGYYAGYVIDFSNSLLTSNILASFRLETYLNGVLQDSGSVNSGVSATALSGAAGKLYLSFKTTKNFNEIRLIFSSTLGAISNMRVYYAMAFAPDCGYVDNNGLCYDQIGNPGSAINFNGGLLGALVTLGNPQALLDGNRNTAATLTLPAGVSLLATPPFVGVKDLGVIYPAGTKAGFVIGYNSGLLSSDVLNTLGIQTYLHGVLQETAQASGGGSLLKLGALSISSGDKKEISFATTKPYNEVRLIVSQPATVNVGSINIYYAFESGASCTDCRQPLISSASAPYDGSVNAANTGVTGVLCLSSLNGTANLTDASLTNAATFNTTLGVACNANLSVRNGGTDLPAGTFAGFAISKQAGLLGLGLLDGITINLYRDGNTTPVASNSGASLLSAGLLTGTDSIGFIGFKSPVAFDEVQINIDAGLLAVGLGGTYNIHYAYVIRDDDNDGMADCAEVCGLAAADSVDSDNDGTPDPCDACATAVYKSPFGDTDNDGVPDACDADTDNDGIADAHEDANGNGNPVDDDMDSDGIANYQDLDSDNDGINDLVEAGLSTSLLASIDANNDGVIDASVPKGTNGMANALETTDASTAQSNFTRRDTDGEGRPDYLDLDSDNDGINDIVESGYGGVADADGNGMADGADTDRDGIADVADGNVTLYGDGAGSVASRDRDGDSVPDYRDLDSDNDGISDLRESGFVMTDADGNGVVDGTDTDNDGIVGDADGRNGAIGDAGAGTPKDTDSDGIADAYDLDSDNDTKSDLVESGQTGYADADNDGVVDGPDTDGDGVMNSVDGNPTVYGDLADPSLADQDGDNAPDYNDVDSNPTPGNDINDNGYANLDGDNDGRVDNPTDPDGDGVPNNNGLDFHPAGFGGLGEPTPVIVKVMLQGALFSSSNGLMRDNLRQQGFIPLNQPYNSSLSARFAQAGTGGSEQTTSAVLSANAGTGDAIVDWVMLEFRKADTPSKVVQTISVLLQRDGDLVSSAGLPIRVVLPDGNYYLAVKHRNHLGAMTNAAIVSSRDTAIFDFTTASNTDIYHLSGMYDGNEMAVVNGVKALWGGNVNMNNRSTYDGPINDRATILAQVMAYPGNTSGLSNYANAFGYFTGDVIMDGRVVYDGPFNDRAYLLNIVLTAPMNTSQLMNFSLIVEQIP